MPTLTVRMEDGRDIHADTVLFEADGLKLLRSGKTVTVHRDDVRSIIAESPADQDTAVAMEGSV